MRSWMNTASSPPRSGCAGPCAKSFLQTRRDYSPEEHRVCGKGPWQVLNEHPSAPFGLELLESRLAASVLHRLKGTFVVLDGRCRFTKSFVRFCQAVVCIPRGRVVDDVLAEHFDRVVHLPEPQQVIPEGVPLIFVETGSGRARIAFGVKFANCGSAPCERISFSIRGAVSCIFRNRAIPGRRC